MTQLEGTENRITVERKNFNDTVNALNVYIRSFPANIVASLFNFEKAQQFEAQTWADVAPTVDFNAPTPGGNPMPSEAIPTETPSPTPTVQ